MKDESCELQAVYCQGSVCDLVDHQRLSHYELLALEADLLIPAALENAFTERNADDIKAKVVVELANGPVSTQADQALFDRGVTVIPVANAGGVTVSHFEWVQNRTGLAWTVAEVRSRLRDRMVAETQRLWTVHEQTSMSLRVAAYVQALRRIGEATDAKGHKEHFARSQEL